MKRRLTGREKALLGILVILILVSGYYLWFYVPSQDRLASLESQILATQDAIDADIIKISKKQKMEQELEEIFENDPDPVSMAAYDNIQNVMLELNTILSQTDDYSLNFDTADTSQADGIVRRRISLQFKCVGYEAAKNVLQELHDSSYRCMLDDLSLSETERTVTDGTFVGGWLSSMIEGDTLTGGETQTRVETVVSVSASLVFFEYQS